MVMYRKVVSIVFLLLLPLKQMLLIFLEELHRNEGDFYAVRFIRERTSILIRKDEESFRINRNVILNVEFMKGISTTVVLYLVHCCLF
jgi:hypothetical protein